MEREEGRGKGSKEKREGGREEKGGKIREEERE